MLGREADVPHGDHLLARIAGFGRYLRSLGMEVGTGRVMDLVRALDVVGLGREDFRLAARATLVASHRDALLFDEAFDHYWGGASAIPGPGFEEGAAVGAQSGAVESADRRPPALPRRAGGRRPPAGPPEGAGDQPRDQPDERGETETVRTYSATELLGRKDFALLTTEEVEQARRLLERGEWSVGRRRSRRTEGSRKGPSPDMRRLLRGLARTGEIPEVGRRRPRTKPRPLVVLCDVSGSMDRYSRLLLHWLHTVGRGTHRAEVFVFGTRVTRITHQLRGRDVDAALDRVSAEVLDWAGGTRIGECLRAFNVHWARRVLRRGAVVLVISDGWDRGDPERLRAEMERLQRGSHRLIWLNPLLGSPGYEPLTRGIRAALPYVDLFLPVHNLDSLDALAHALAAIPEGRPARRHRPGART